MVDRDLPLKMEISANIKRLMSERKWNQVELSEKSGISKSTLSDYINCNTLIKPGNVEKLADAFGVLKSEIDPSFRTSNAYYLKANENLVLLPVVGSISCGNGTIAYEDVEKYEPTPQVWLNGGEYFYLRAKGDSMINARIYDGDLLLIRRQEEVENGEIAAVLIDGEAVLKRVYKTEQGILLQSENPAYSPIFLDKDRDEDKDTRIIGKLKKSVISY